MNSAFFRATLSLSASAASSSRTVDRSAAWAEGISPPILRDRLPLD